MLLLAFGSASADDEWPEVRVVGPFIVRSDASLSLDELEQLEELHSLQNDLTEKLGLPELEEHVEVYILSDESAYRSLLQQHFPEAPFRRAFYIRQDGPGIVLLFRQDQWMIDLRHECTHALLHASVPQIPIWIDEGLAEYYEAPAPRRASDHPNVRDVKTALRLGLFPSLERLESKTDFNQMGEMEYQSSWAWAHFLLNGPPEARAALQRCITGWAKTNEPVEPNAALPPVSISQELETQLPNARRLLREYFLSPPAPDNAED
jgi:hypothetical protein